MTIAQAIAHFDALTPNQLPVPVKVRWLSQLDGLLVQEQLAPEGVGDFSGYNADTDISTELLVEYPHEEIYRWYLEMKTWDALGETAKYNNATQKYNAALVALADCRNRNRILPARCLRLV